jgi:hypothetical protein
LQNCPSILIFTTENVPIKNQKQQKMKKLLFILTAAIMLAGCSGQQKKDATAEGKQQQEETTPKIELANFNEKAGDYVGEIVAVNGIVDHVCKHGGKKILLVSDEADLHVTSDERFSDDLMGSEIEVEGIVRELRIDEAYCLKMEEDNIASHKTGETDETLYERKQRQVEQYRDSMKKANVDHLSFYSLEYVAHNTIK